MQANGEIPTAGRSAMIYTSLYMTNLDSEKTKAHYTCRNELKSKRDPPDIGAARHMKTDTNCLISVSAIQVKINECGLNGL
jgi:hypothetical protein